MMYYGSATTHRTGTVRPGRTQKLTPGRVELRNLSFPSTTSTLPFLYRSLSVFFPVATWSPQYLWPPRISTVQNTSSSPAMASLQNIPYDLLLSIAQHLDLADICALQLVRNSRLNIPPTRF